jgi:hypothetical protein
VSLFEVSLFEVSLFKVSVFEVSLYKVSLFEVSVYKVSLFPRILTIPILQSMLQYLETPSLKQIAKSIFCQISLPDVTSQNNKPTL